MTNTSPNPALTLEQLYKLNAKLENQAAPFLTNNSFLNNTDPNQPWSKDIVEFLGVSVLLFGVIVMVLMFILFLRNRTTELVLRAFGIPLIIVSSVFLIIAGYTENQIAPVMGLLGTIAGYLLAKTESNGNGRLPSPPTPEPPQIDVGR